MCDNGCIREQLRISDATGLFSLYLCTLFTPFPLSSIFLTLSFYCLRNKLAFYQMFWHLLWYFVANEMIFRHLLVSLKWSNTFGATVWIHDCLCVHEGVTEHECVWQIFHHLRDVAGLFLDEKHFRIKNVTNQRVCIARWTRPIARTTYQSWTLTILVVRAYVCMCVRVFVRVRLLFFCLSFDC